MKRFIIILILVILGSTAMAQKVKLNQPVPDSILEKQHSPTKATLMSMCLPGLGQIYNKKYWKVPIIYAGFGVFTYLIVFNTNYYLTYKSAYIESSNGDSTGNYSDIVKKYPKESILSSREYYRRNLEITIIFTVIWYALNMVDASVDAHLFTYNITNDLSLRVEPALIPPAAQYRNYTSGIKFCLKF
ncbi:MAG: DUF5683 domain-containing protein [Bacteroidetes bacterium]|nr:DUF5683 domain-containing protein [Bacteroidota bacterium]